MHTFVDFSVNALEGNNCTYRHEDTHTCEDIGTKNEQFQIRHTSYRSLFSSRGSSHKVSVSSVVLKIAPQQQ